MMKQVYIFILLEFQLNIKFKGRKREYHVSEMSNYQAMKEELNRNKDKLEKANIKSLELDNNSKDVKNKIDNLKQSKLNKENYILSSDDKDKLISYIDKVDNTNKEYINIQSLSVAVENVDTELVNNKEQIKVLTENNKALTLRNESLTES